MREMRRIALFTLHRKTTLKQQNRTSLVISELEILSNFLRRIRQACSCISPPGSGKERKRRFRNISVTEFGSEANLLLESLAFATDEASSDTRFVITRTTRGALYYVLPVEWKDDFVPPAQLTDITLAVAELTGSDMIYAALVRIK